MTEDEMYDIIRGYEDSERDYHERNIELEDENAKLREVIDDITEVVEVSDPALVRFIAKRMKGIRTEEDS